MDNTLVLAVVASVVTSITSVVLMVLKYKQDDKEYARTLAERNRSLSADNTANKKLDEIHTLTNSTLTAANKEISDLKTEVHELREIIKQKMNGDIDAEI